MTGVQTCALPILSEVLLKRILESEEEHIDWLETQLSLIETLGDKAYLAEQLK